MPAPPASSRTPRITSQSPEVVRRVGLIDRRGGPRYGPPASSSEGGYAPLGLPRPALGRAPAQPWRASGLAQDVSSAEEPAGAHGEHDDEDDETDDLAVGAAERRRARRLRQAQHEAPDEGAHHRAEPGEDDDDQRLERPLEPDGRADRVGDGDERAGGARQRGAEREGQEIR